MKTSFIVATLAFAASVSAQVNSDVDLGTKWCQAFSTACTQGSSTVCGAGIAPKANICQSTFVNGKCTTYRVRCECAKADGTLLTGTDPVLESTFKATQGACADLARSQIPSNNTLTTTTTSTTVTATSSSSSPSGTTAPGKGNSAGKSVSNAYLAVAAAISAAALAL